jgi:hypothetical protein
MIGEATDPPVGVLALISEETHELRDENGEKDR